MSQNLTRRIKEKRSRKKKLIFAMGKGGGNITEILKKVKGGKRGQRKHSQQYLTLQRNVKVTRGGRARSGRREVDTTDQ